MKSSALASVLIVAVAATAEAQMPRSPAAPPTVASPTPQPHNGPGVQTAVGRVFYGGGGITPDIEVKEPANTPTRARIRSPYRLHASLPRFYVAAALDG